MVERVRKQPPATTIIVKDGIFEVDVKIGENTKFTKFPFDGTVVEEEKVNGHKYKVLWLLVNSGNCLLLGDRFAV